MFYGDGLRAHFLFVAQGTNIQQLIESTAIALGYELVDLEFGPRGRLLRVFIDRPAAETGASGSVTVDDCQRMTRQAQRVLEVEGIDYDRLEVSSPGLDRVLKKPADFRRFSGAKAEVRLRVPLNGRRRFVGIVRGASDAGVDLEVDGVLLSLAYVNMDKARLVPKL
jgi:ribosome maturation factor RimP